MKEYEIRFTKEAIKDIKILSPLKKKLYDIVTNKLCFFPYSGKKLVGDLSGSYSLRLSYKDRIIYSVEETHKKLLLIEHALR